MLENKYAHSRSGELADLIYTCSEIKRQFLFAFSMNQIYNNTIGTANHSHIIFRLEMTGLQAIGYHKNEVKMPWYWIGTGLVLKSV